MKLLNGETIETAIELMMQSNQVGYKILFNSVCACASVNHLHLHQYYTDYRIPAEDIECEPIISVLTKVSGLEEASSFVSQTLLTSETYQSLI